MMFIPLRFKRSVATALSTPPDKPTTMFRSMFSQMVTLIAQNCQLLVKKRSQAGRFENLNSWQKKKNKIEKWLKIRDINHAIGKVRHDSFLILCSYRVPRTAQPLNTFLVYRVSVYDGSGRFVWSLFGKYFRVSGDIQGKKITNIIRANIHTVHRDCYKIVFTKLIDA